MKKNILIFLFILLQYTLANSQNQAHRIIKERMESKNVPGLAFLIARNGKIIDEGYFGKANLEMDVDVSKNSVFAIASMSKTYTAAAILLMAEKGQLRLDDPVKKYIPEAPDTWNPITIKHLLTHSSGLVEDWSLYDWNTSNELFLKTQTDNDFLKVHFENELKFEPGTDISYASGHFILGIVIERITGESYGDYLEKHIFQPLSLNETFVDHPYKIIPHRVSGYFDYDPDKINSPMTGLGNGILIAPVAYGRGDVGIRTTANDLLKFYDSLFTGALLNESSKQSMFDPATLDNGDFISTGAGWMNWPLGGIAISEHSGGFRTGFSSQALVVPKDRFAVIILTNLFGGASFPLAQELASLYYPELEQLSKKSPVEDTNTAMTHNHLDFFQHIGIDVRNEGVHENFPFSYYSKSLKKSISRTKSITYLGEKSVKNENVNFFNVDIHTLRYYRLNSEKTLYTTVYLDGKDRLVFMDYPETK